MAKITLMKEITKGIWDQNPGLRQLIGLCPFLAVTTSAENGLAMGFATTFVLITSSSVISMVRNMIPPQIRIAGYIVIIATFVTLADKFIAAYHPGISRALGPFIPLIIVNCIILGRAEAFASKSGPISSAADGLGMGLGVIMLLVVLGSIREIIGAGTIFSMRLTADLMTPWMVMILPPGAFLTLGLLIGLFNIYNARRAG
jgi:electron transport complex protein RnfE